MQDSHHFNLDLITSSAEETIAFGEKLGRFLKKGDVVCLFGDLASGKTTLIKGIAKSICKSQNLEVLSPTFTYLNVYEGEKNVYHFDLYRLANEEEFLSLGFEEFLYADGVCCIEWSERIKHLLPAKVIWISCTHISRNVRNIKIRKNI